MEDHPMKTGYLLGMVQGSEASNKALFKEGNIFVIGVKGNVNYDIDTCMKKMPYLTIVKRLTETYNPNHGINDSHILQPTIIGLK
jgi:hypothetical protein